MDRNDRLRGRAYCLIFPELVDGVKLLLLHFKHVFVHLPAACRCRMRTWPCCSQFRCQRGYATSRTRSLLPHHLGDLIQEFLTWCLGGVTRFLQRFLMSIGSTSTNRGHKTSAPGRQRGGIGEDAARRPSAGERASGTAPARAPSLRVRHRRGRDRRLCRR
jgi:hypothetical protein